jgi:hypothetical protein
MADVATLSIKVDTTDINRADSAMQGLGKTGSMLEGAIKKLAVAFTAFKFAEMVKDIALMSARYETLGVAMVAVGKNAGYSAMQMNYFSEQVKAMGISMVESRNVLLMMAGSQLDLAKASALARVAQDAAVIGNINSSEAFVRMVHGIRSGETEILRTLGINVSFEQSYKKLATQLNITTNNLTDTQKASARMNAVLEYGTRIAGTYEAAMGTAGKQLLSMQRYWDDLKTVAGSVFQEALGTGVSALSEALKGAKEWFERNSVAVADLASSVGLLAASLVDLLKTLGLLGSGRESVTTLAQIFKGLGLAMAFVKDVVHTLLYDLLKLGQALSWLTLGSEEQQKWFKDQAEEFARMTDAVDRYADKLSDAQERLVAFGAKKSVGDDMQKNIDALVASMKQYENEIARYESRTGKSAGKDSLGVLEEMKLQIDILKAQRDAYLKGIPEQMGPAATQRHDGVVSDTDIKAAKKRIEVMKESQAAVQALLLQKEIDAIWAPVASNKAAQEEIELRQYQNLIEETTTSLHAMKKAKEDVANYALRLNDQYTSQGIDNDRSMTQKALDSGSISMETYTRHMRDLYKEELKLKSLNGDLWSSMVLEIESFSQRSTDAFVDFCFTGKNAFSDLITSMLKDLARLAIQQQVMAPLWGWIAQGIAGWAGGGVTSGVNSYNLGGGALSGTTPLASGGPVSAGGMYMVGERGPELFVSKSAGQIVPNHALGGQVNNVSIVVNENGQANAKGDGPSGVELARNIKSAVISVLVEQKRNGGLLAGGVA